MEDRLVFIFCDQEFGHGNTGGQGDGKLFFEGLVVFFEF